MAYIGTVSKEQEDMITLLKSAVLVEEVHGEDNVTLIKLGKDAIVAALVKINSESGKRIVHDFPSTWVQSANRSDITARMLFPYCENPALSLMYPGVTYNAIDIPDDTAEISDVDRQQLLDVLCCFYNFDGNRPKAAGDLRDVWDKVVRNQAAHRHIYWPSV